MKQILPSTFLLLTLLLFNFSFQIQAQPLNEYLQTGAVQNSWYTTDCSIDTAVIDVRPKGLFAEVSITMDFSTRGLSFNNYDSLEIQMMFRLPENVEVTDMVLWVYGQPESAGVYELNNAINIYEEIVARRTDPALLYKYRLYDHSDGSVTIDDNYYKFSIFPMLNSMPRKAKITYQVPLKDIGQNLFSIPVPINITNLSDLDIEEYTLNYYPGAEFSEPQAWGQSGISFTQVQGVYSASLQDYEGGELNLLVSSNRNTPYLGVFENGQTDYFQFGFKPAEVFSLSVENNRKLTVIIDYKQSFMTGSYNLNTILDGFKLHLVSQLSETDSIRVMFNGNSFNPWPAEEWMGMDSAGKQWIYDNLNETYFSGTSSLNNILEEAVEFTNDSDGEILIISNSNEYWSSNYLIVENMLAQFSELPRIGVVDVDDFDHSNESFWINNQQYYGNEYLYLRLSSEYNAIYQSINDLSYQSMLYQVMAESYNGGQSLQGINVNLTRDNGFTYSTYQIGANAVNFPNQTYSITGKAVGSGDFHANIGIVDADGQLYQAQFDFNQPYELDTVTDNIWGGLHQRSLYGSVNNLVIANIIQNSMDLRVLSRYTAFLALEPTEGPEPLTVGEVDENIGLTIGVEEEEKEDVQFKLYPNPVVDVMSLEVVGLARSEQLLVEIRDLSGKLILEPVFRKIAAGNSIIPLNLSSLTQGTYVVSITRQSGSVITKKVVKM